MNVLKYLQFPYEKGDESMHLKNSELFDYLPNRYYPSDHMLLCADLELKQ